MKTKILFYLCLLLVVSSCEKSVIMDECHDSRQTSSSVNSNFSYFLNTESYTDKYSGDTSITGDIICTKETEYTFVFAFNGSAGVKYEAGIGTNVRFYNTNGSSFRTITTKLAPGTHHCFVELYFSNENQTADARLVIQKINGSLPEGEGSGDLVAWGTSKIYNPGGSEGYH